MMMMMTTTTMMMMMKKAKMVIKTMTMMIGTRMGNGIAGDTGWELQRTRYIELN